ncbi:MAG: amino acid ABC transporter permease [Erysipelotrichaceae bacterium]|nr:amino acid ABC transporter permease [Erysipelotrichaceae bacterium]
MLEQIARIWSRYSGVYLDGLLGTLWLSLVTAVFAVLIGIAVSMLKRSKIKIVKVIVDFYIEILRGTPILLQLYFFWLLLPKIVPFEMSDTACIISALVVNSSAYVAEDIRSGIQAVDDGQREAGLSLGMSMRHVMRKIILPQAIRNIMPALGNEFISIVKATSLASVFFVPELTTAYRTVQSATFLAIPSLLISGLIYLVLTFSMSRVVGVVEKRMKVYDR